MCGISGIIGSGWRPEQLRAMVNVQKHRGPDDYGLYMDETRTVGLGHNRLSIIDLSSAGRQPMANRDSSLWIVFNGKIYNYRELRAELFDYPYRSQTDTEVLLAAYERWGDDCVDHCIGMFAFAIWDSRQEKLFCARDRLGIKPFHYAWHNNNFILASEIKAILAAGLEAKPDWTTWATYLTHGWYDHSEATFFEGIRSLAPGHVLTLQNDRLVRRCYWDITDRAAEPLQLTDDDAANQLSHRLKDAVRLRLRSDVPLGVNLSGGLDSASLMVTVDGLLQSGGEIQTFTASFDDPEYAEQPFADQVPRRSRWSEHIHRLGAEQAWDLAEAAQWHLEAPFGGAATLSYYALHEQAQRQGVTVLLEGQGVDELLAGYAYFRPAHLRDLLEGHHWRDMRDELRAAGCTRHRALALLRRAQNGNTVAAYQDGSAHLQPECVRVDLQDLAADRPRFPEPFSEHLNNALYRDLRYTKLPRVLRMNDRLSMAFSRELREPFLDHRIVEFLFRLPSGQKLRAAQGKFLLRHAMTGRLPDPVRLAEKRAVVTPQREWLRNELRPHVLEIIHSREFAERGVFDVNRVRRTYDRFCAEEYDNSFFVWQWVNTELWFRTFIDRHTITQDSLTAVGTYDN